ncbi:30S ribosomal protein S12 methylthiotransferase RimO [Desulfopila sp. IMCC35008]|uniref:30S ribosomal protein S12 methylthiotransferase RimO n=1 Tax=Desulfopila sp. IMCC35008 TaxID=2653858 RepID=UPI0013CF439C|nr:30S ribosomal protein S12 methylthiotransferase RimO [Desulfopila sp. IMCC35008]
MRTFHLVSLGCAKNLVDSELMIGSLMKNGWQLENDPEAAELLLINTCGFIQPAVEEAIEEILDLAAIKAQSGCKLVVVGCMVQRYKDGLVGELPEVDLFIGTEACHRLAELIEPLFASGTTPEKVITPSTFLMDAAQPRVLATPPFRAWCKITEGCDNRCSYCMIPSIRGPLRSRPVDDLIREAEDLENRGVRELSLIAQDLTAYGDDRAGDDNLILLLDNLLRTTTIPWFRLLYLYPTGVSEQLLELMAENDRILPYLDIPFQHVSDSILEKMNRRHNGNDLYELVEKTRRFLPDVALRSTFLVGFPGETEQDVEQLIEFLKKARLDHVGVFPYANEEGCPAEKFPDQLPEQEKIARCEAVMEVQSTISQEILRKYVGRREQVLVEGLSRETDLLLEGRTRYQAPDVDGCVYINEGTANAGDIVTVEITESQIYDLVGGITAGS